jgi:phosphoadenosine phosphosulfate reductase
MQAVMTEQVAEYNKQLSNASPEEAISFFLRMFPGKTAFATSLSLEDQVIMQMLSVTEQPVFCFTLDTGRLFQETYDLLDLTVNKYKIRIHAFFPDSAAVEKMVSEKGINLFYESVENRKLCCHIRKVAPMQRALKGMKVWISGLRKEQAVTRKDLELVEWDETNGKIKVNPLARWTDEEVWNRIHLMSIPYNPLHDIGYPSIGCLPCTRAIQPGEDFRSGRWWWELPENKECGIHSKSGD